MIKNLISIVHKYERYLSPGMLLLGFIVDSITLTRADARFDNLVLLWYLLLAGLCILFLNAHSAGGWQHEKVQKLAVLVPLGLQFAFGGLFSGFTVLYSRSSSLGASWPFMIIMIALLIGNEYLRNRYSRLVFQVGIYFVAVFSYLIFAIPVLLNEIGPWIFILSGALSLIVLGILIYLLTIFASQALFAYKRTLAYIIIGIYVIFNVLYFLNFIPPIPLALKEAVVVHDLKFSNSSFVMSYEIPRWYHFFKEYNPTFNRFGNEPVYVFSSIYAPADIGVTIIHEWSRFDESRDRWVVESRLQYPIFGGRETGFRGYSLKNNVVPGKWKVSIKTKHGQVLGRVKFTVVPSTDKPPVRTVVK